MTVTTKRARRVSVCDSCLTAAYDEGATDRQTQRTICAEFGADIADHLCDAVEEPGTRCGCGCHRSKWNSPRRWGREEGS